MLEYSGSLIINYPPMAYKNDFRFAYVKEAIFNLIKTKKFCDIYK